MGKIKGEAISASWYNPRNDTSHLIGNYNNRGLVSFIPPEAKKDEKDNDWVLVLETFEKTGNN